MTIKMVAANSANGRNSSVIPDLVMVLIVLMVLTVLKKTTIIVTIVTKVKK